MKEAPETSSLATEAYNIVRQRILRGELAMGQVISRRKLAGELGMSFIPVSEALLRLEFEGFLESRPRAGTRVRIPSPEDVKGLYVVREALEVQAAILFATASTPAERSELRKLAARVDALSMQPERTPYLNLHQKLHRRIAECTHCAPLCEAIEKTHALSTIWIGVMRKPSASDSATRHQELVDALASGDPAVAAEAVRGHLHVGLQRALEVLEPYFRLRKANGRTFFRGVKKIKSTRIATGVETIN
jgi:DNA-binding GntR family transcriptional regulator